MGNELSVCDPCCTSPSSISTVTTSLSPRPGHVPASVPTKTKNNTDDRSPVQGLSLAKKAQNNTEVREDPHLKSANGKDNELQEQGDILSRASSCQSFTEMSPRPCTSPRPCPSPPRHPKQQVEAAAGGTNGCEGGGSTPFSPFSGIIHASTSLETSAAILAASTSAPTLFASVLPSHRQKNEGAGARGVHSEYSAIVSTYIRYLLCTRDNSTTHSQHCL